MSMRLCLPEPDDRQAIFESYAGDREVTRYVSWPTHRSVQDTYVLARVTVAGIQPATPRFPNDSDLVTDVCAYAHTRVRTQ